MAPDEVEAVYGATHRRWVAILGILTIGLVLPGGLGVIVLVAGVLDPSLGSIIFGLVWCSIWSAVGLASTWWHREYRVADRRLVIRSPFWTREIAAGDLLEFRPARFRFPGVVVRASGGRVHRLAMQAGLVPFVGALATIAPEATILFRLGRGGSASVRSSGS